MSLRTLPGWGRHWAALTILALLGPIGLLAQSSAPWQGRGVAPAGASSSGAPHATVAARMVAMVGLTVSDMERSVDFYTRVLDFVEESDGDAAGEPIAQLDGVAGAHVRVVRLRLGEERLQLTQYLSPGGRPAPADARSNDRWFQHVAIIVSDMDRAYGRLRQSGVTSVSVAPQTLPRTIPAAAGIRAFYFRDPDGHPLEVLQFPPDKGAPKWHQDQGRLFLGIDHTAIVVEDTERSLGFYRDVLGFKVEGESYNYGVEQERLNNVPGARLRITGLRVAAGPGVEFLQYLAPGDGQPFPDDEQANDLVHWQTTILVPDAAAAAAVLRRGSFRLLSSGVVSLPDTTLGFRRGVRVRDPDGHVIQLVDR
jgi:catechol 2,3-dioxygenase-like lactoylglutathione lyase family enzyme